MCYNQTKFVKNELYMERFHGNGLKNLNILKSQVFKFCFGAKSFVLGKKLAKLRKEEVW